MFVLFVLVSCIHHAPVNGAADEDGIPIAYGAMTPPELLPYQQCGGGGGNGTFDLDLSGIDLGEMVGGWANGEFVYVYDFSDGTHYVSCSTDWTCPDPMQLPGGLGMGCIDQSACCDLGVVQE